MPGKPPSLENPMFDIDFAIFPNFWGRFQKKLVDHWWTQTAWWSSTWNATKSEPDFVGAPQIQSSRCEFRILDFGFWVLAFGLVLVIVLHWQRPTGPLGFGIPILDFGFCWMQAFGCWILQLLPKFGFCIRYTRPRRLESVHLFTYCMYLFVHVFIFHYMYIYIYI